METFSNLTTPHFQVSISDPPRIDVQQRLPVLDPRSTLRLSSSTLANTTPLALSVVSSLAELPTPLSLLSISSSAESRYVELLRTSSDHGADVELANTG